MAEISRFCGIVIKMYPEDHDPPHFHAVYGGNEALIDINTHARFAGYLPPKALGMVMEWASRHPEEPMLFWDKAQNLESLGQIEPLA